MSAETPAAAKSTPDALAGPIAAHLKPRARGWIHLYAASVAAVAGVALVVASWAVSGRTTGLATLAYTIATVSMFAVSAVYHRVQWGSPTTRMWMRRLDHSMIFIFIAGSYTPLALTAMPGTSGRWICGGVWGGALAGTAVKLFWPTAPRPLGVALYLALGWVAIWFLPTFLHTTGVAVVVLLIVGGAIYSLGAVFYAVRWPDPWPETFGYHEFFHTATAVAAICHYLAIWLVVCCSR